MSRRETTYLDLELEFRLDRDKAWGCHDPRGSDELVWLPKSQCEVSDTGRLTRGVTYTFRVPEWIAKAKGLA